MIVEIKGMFLLTTNSNFIHMEIKDSHDTTPIAVLNAN